MQKKVFAIMTRTRYSFTRDLPDCLLCAVGSSLRTCWTNVPNDGYRAALDTMADGWPSAIRRLRAPIRVECLIGLEALAAFHDRVAFSAYSTKILRERKILRDQDRLPRRLNTLNTDKGTQTGIRAIGAPAVPSRRYRACLRTGGLRPECRLEGRVR